MDSNDNRDLLPYHRKLSTEEKFADDAKWIADCANQIDRDSGYTDFEFQQRIAINYAIAKGKGGKALREYLTIMAKDNNVPEAAKYKNYDILSPIFKAQVGEQQKRELHAIAKDISGYNLNATKKKKLELQQEWVKTNMAQPMTQQATQEILIKHGIQNPQELAPEEQDQINSEIQELVKFKTPKDIDKFMRDDYKSSSETQIQEILDWYVKEFDVKFITDESFKHLLCAGREIAYQTIENNKPVCRIINPKGFRYFAEHNTHFIDEGLWWSFEEDISYASLITSIPDDPKFIKELRSIVSNYGFGVNTRARDYMRGEAPGRVNEVVSELNTKTNGAFIDNMPKNLGSREGQHFLRGLYNLFGSSRTGYNDQNLTSNTFRKTNVCYTAFTAVYLVERYNETSDKMVNYWVGENYETNRELDKKVTKFWAPEYYSADKLGQEAGLVYNKQRLPFQNRSVTDPWDIIPSYTGVEYGRMFNNAEPVAPMDFGKPPQYEYNVLKHHVEELDKTNIGRVFAVPESFIPAKYPPEQWLQFIKKNKVVPIDENNSSLNPAIAAQLLKSIDLTNNADIGGYLQRLGAIKADAEQLMSYSPAALGQGAASTTATKNQQDIIQHSYKTEDIYTLHETFINRMLNHAMIMMKNALLKNDDLREALLSIPSLAALNIDTDLLLNTTPFIKVLNTTEEIRDIDNVKDLLQPMIQNGIITKMSQVMGVQFKRNSAALLNLSEDAERKAEEAQQAAIKREQEEADKQRAHVESMAQKELDYRKYEFDETIKKDKYVSDNEKTKFQLQADSDQNKIPDAVQTAEVRKQQNAETLEAQKEMNREDNVTKLKIANKKVSSKT